MTPEQIAFLTRSLNSALAQQRPLVRVSRETLADIVSALETQSREIEQLRNVAAGLQHALANAPKANEYPSPNYYGRNNGRTR